MKKLLGVFVLGLAVGLGIAAALTPGTVTKAYHRGYKSAMLDAETTVKICSDTYKYRPAAEQITCIDAGLSRNTRVLLEMAADL